MGFRVEVRSMSEMKASYGFYVHEVPEGWKFTYNRASIFNVLPAALLVYFSWLVVFLVAVIIIAMFSPALSGWFSLAVVAFCAWRYYKYRIAVPRSFVLTPSHLIQGGKQFSRQDIGEMYVSEPSQPERSITIQRGGLMVSGDFLQTSAAIGNAIGNE
jgi:hypothetical protein